MHLLQKPASAKTVVARKRPRDLISLPFLITQCLPTFIGLRHPRAEKHTFSAPIGEPTAICFKVWWHFENAFLVIYWRTHWLAAPLSVVNDTLGCRGTPVGNYCITCVLWSSIVFDIRRTRTEDLGVFFFLYEKRILQKFLNFRISFDMKF